MLIGYVLVLPDGRQKVVESTPGHPEGAVCEVHPSTIGVLQDAYETGWMAPPAWVKPASLLERPTREAYLRGNADRHGFGFCRAAPRRRTVVAISADGTAICGKALLVPDIVPHNEESEAS